MRDYTTKSINLSPIGRKKVINNGILYAGGNDSSTDYGAIYTYSNI